MFSQEPFSCLFFESVHSISFHKTMRCISNYMLPMRLSVKGICGSAVEAPHRDKFWYSRLWLLMLLGCHAFACLLQIMTLL